MSTFFEFLLCLTEGYKKGTFGSTSLRIFDFVRFSE